MFKPIQMGKRKRYTYAQINEVLRMPHLLDLQRDSYTWFIEEGIRDSFDDITPIESNERGNDKDGKLKLYFGEYHFEEPKYSIRECKERDATYSAPLRMKVRLENAETQEIQETEIYMGDFPLMTDTGTFVINGAERVIVSQLVRSPGVYFAKEVDAMGKSLFSSTIIPNRGAWIELESDANDIINVRIDRNRKMPATVLVRALGYETNESIEELFGYDPRITETLKKDVSRTKYEALIEIYKKLRPGEPPSVESATQMFNNLFFDPRRYDLAHIGRYKLGKKLGWENRLRGQKLAEPIVNPDTGEILREAETVVRATDIDALRASGVFAGEGAQEIYIYSGDGQRTIKMVCNDANLSDNVRTVAPEDMIANISYLLNLIEGVGQTDDIDHLGNRRLRCVGELLQNQIRVGLARMERTAKERMAVQDRDSLTPQSLINIRPIVASLKEFFGSSQL